MKFALIGFGRNPIPGEFMGSIENIIWQYKLQLEKLGHQVDIYNSIWIHEVLYELNRKDYDFIHLHSDIHACHFNAHLKKPYVLTSHGGCFPKFVPGKFDFFPAFNYLYDDSLKADGNLVIHPGIIDKYRQSRYRGWVRHLRNPVETELFAWQERGNGRAVYVGKIAPRKRQAPVAKLLAGKTELDFIGPWDRAAEPNFITGKTCRHLGEWSREQVHQGLTGYSCLVLLSGAESAPLVTIEALAAGLSVVVNEASSGNLDPQPFITVLPDDENDPDVIAAAIEKAVKDNPQHRAAARDYAVNRFSYPVVTHEYLHLVDEFRSILK
jgi:glycosyltransferase involved in cell wall biosynthesis